MMRLRYYDHARVLMVEVGDRWHENGARDRTVNSTV